MLPLHILATKCKSETYTVNIKDDSNKVIGTKQENYKSCDDKKVREEEAKLQKELEPIDDVPFFWKMQTLLCFVGRGQYYFLSNRFRNFETTKEAFEEKL